MIFAKLGYFPRPCHLSGADRSAISKKHERCWYLGAVFYVSYIAPFSGQERNFVLPLIAKVELLTNLWNIMKLAFAVADKEEDIAGKWGV